MPQSVRAVDGGRIKGSADVSNVVEIRVQQILPNAKNAYWTVHGSFAQGQQPPALPGLATTLFNSIGSAWTTRLATFMHPTTSLVAVFVRDMTSHLNAYFQSTGAAIVGTGTGAAMPSDAAIVLTENVAQRGRGLKGRIYLPGWTVGADAGGGVISDPVFAALNLFGTDLQTAINASGLTACVAQVGRQAYIGLTGTQHNARPQGHVTVTSYACRDKEWDTQRRRGQ